VIELGAPVPISTGGARTAQAHWDGANGGPNESRVRELSEGFAGVPFPEREVRISQQSMRDGLRYMVTHPVKELSLIPRRLYFLYRHDHAAINLVERREVSVDAATLDRLRTAADAYYFALIAWSVLGVCLWWHARREVAVLVIGLALSLSALIGLLYAGVDRYHASLVPFMSLAAAPLIVFAWDSLRAPTPLPLSVPPPGDLPSRSRSVT
jgi:hypothetical protein